MRILSICLMIVAGAMFASAVADGSSLVKKSGDTLYIYKCGEVATSNRPELVSEKLGKQAYDSLMATTNFRPTGFAGLTRTRSNIIYENHGDKGFYRVIDAEKKSNVLMFFILVLLSAIVLLAALRQALAITPKRFIFFFYSIVGLVLGLSLTTATLWIINGFNRELPEFAIAAIFLTGLILATVAGVVLAKIFKEDRVKTDPDKRVKKMLRIYYLAVAILIVLGIIKGGLAGLYGMVIIGLLICVPIFCVKQISDFLKKPRTPKQKPKAPVEAI